MFDIGWSELLIIGIVTLLFVGPKDLPVFLRTIGRYIGAIKKQAGEFRAQFDEALRETELDQLRKDVVGMKNEVEKSVRDVGRQVEDDFAEVRRDVEGATKPQLEKPSAKATPPDDKTGTATGASTPAAAKTGIGTGLDPAPDNAESGSSAGTGSDGASSSDAGSASQASAKAGA